MGIVDTLTTAVAGPFAPALVGSVGGAASAYGAWRANQENVKMAHHQMAFQERMSNTAYQRAVVDMRKAGINPMLAYDKGGASTPGGAMPVIKNALETSSATALQLAKIGAEIENIKSQTELNKSKNSTIEPMVEVGKIVGDAIRDLGTKLPKNPVSQVLDAVDEHAEAYKIRREPGIEVTNHTRRQSALRFQDIKRLKRNEKRIKTRSR